MAFAKGDNWPSLPWSDWAETCAALHLWTQMLGKYRVAHTPWVNHAWHSALYVTPRGMTTGPVHETGGCVSLTLDFTDHRLVAEADGGARDGFALEPMSVAEFHTRLERAVEAVGGTFDIHGAPNELPDAVPFAKDTEARPYDAEAAARFHKALLHIVPVFEHFRTGFLGKVSPVHFFWGSFDLALTRFSGSTAPLHPAGIPNMPMPSRRRPIATRCPPPDSGRAAAAWMRRCSHSYAYPTPKGFADYPVAPEIARFDTDLGEFLLPYADVIASDDPEGMLMDFLQSTYAAAADTGDWNRDALECEIGKPGKPRPLERPA